MRAPTSTSAVVELIRTSEEPQLTGHLGPDLLGSDWDSDEAVRRLSAEPDRPIGEALLDQRNLAGIGNVYKAEVLFLRGVNPWQPTGAVPDLGALVNLARRLLEANKERHGHITPGNWQRGQEHWVYGMTTYGTRRPVPRTGAPDTGVPHGYVRAMLEAIRAASQAVSSWVLVP